MPSSAALSSAVAAIVYLCQILPSLALLEFFPNNGPPRTELDESFLKQFPEHWFHHQKLDHFNSADNRTFAQRYFVNFQFYKPGGPVYLYIGGEGPLSSFSVGKGLEDGLFANETNGGVVALEHRFYGKSQPFGSLATQHLSYLTSRQALHDLAYFQKFLMSNMSLESSPFFCIGGSYPGNLAAWYRLEFPEMTRGCWAASAPVFAQEIWPGYGQMVWKAVSTNWRGEVDESVPAKLYAGYEQLAALAHDGTVEGFDRLKKVLNICDASLVSVDDRNNFENTISTAVAEVMQYNNSGNMHLKEVLDTITKAESPLQAAVDVSLLLGLNKSASGGCVDASITGFYQPLVNDTLPLDGSGNAMRTWTWQTCNEFGYFQTGTSEWGKSTLYTRGVSSSALWQQVCSNVFGIAAEEVPVRIAETNAYYGGKNPKNISHVLFTNGELDAWSLLSITEYPPNHREVYTKLAPLGSHCVGLYAPMEGDVPGAIAIRKQALTLFKSWGNLSIGSSSNAGAEHEVVTSPMEGLQHQNEDQEKKEGYEEKSHLVLQI
eukprot:CAMPEP_0206487942 /NCGR_PEP_ID=MMETSP0324_2-20121206/42027_1 /ASSEMBLY_ACC=CAM_ASM_000836 /TAXON_ID=2866 /ORGANISM="Crypthecodinium cohnii, Strain Seligo" /LENGTH=546 /DNA_ID=CAMNT_0053966691 /DNA_START=110 /DNA_END=1750 /DNA_ORIENTATION=+